MTPEPKQPSTAGADLRELATEMANRIRYWWGNKHFILTSELLAFHERCQRAAAHTESLAAPRECSTFSTVPFGLYAHLRSLLEGMLKDAEEFRQQGASGVSVDWIIKKLRKIEADAPRIEDGLIDAAVLAKVFVEMTDAIMWKDPDADGHFDRAAKKLAALAATPKENATPLKDEEVFDADGSWSKKKWMAVCEYWAAQCREAWQQRDFNSDRIHELERDRERAILEARWEGMRIGAELALRDATIDASQVSNEAARRIAVMNADAVIAPQIDTDRAGLVRLGNTPGSAK